MKDELKVTITGDGFFVEAEGEKACEVAAGIITEKLKKGRYETKPRGVRAPYGLLLKNIFTTFHADGSKEVSPWPRPSFIQEMLDKGDHLDAAEAAAEAILDGLLDTFGTEYSPLAQVALADALKDRLGDTIPAGGPSSWNIADPSPETIAQMLAKLKSSRSGGGSWEEVAELADDTQGVAAPSERPEPSGAAPEEEGGDCPEGEEGGDYPEGVTNMQQ